MQTRLPALQTSTPVWIQHFGTVTDLFSVKTQIGGVARLEKKRKEKAVVLRKTADTFHFICSSFR